MKKYIGYRILANALLALLWIIAVYIISLGPRVYANIAIMSEKIFKSDLDKTGLAVAVVGDIISTICFILSIWALIKGIKHINRHFKKTEV